MSAQDAHVAVGDLVWMKIRGFPRWPARVTADLQTGGVCMRSLANGSRTELHLHSFGDNKSVWVPLKRIEPFEVPSTAQVRQAKGKLKEALEQACNAATSARVDGGTTQNTQPPPGNKRRLGQSRAAAAVAAAAAPSAAAPSAAAPSAAHPFDAAARGGKRQKRASGSAAASSSSGAALPIPSSRATRDAARAAVAAAAPHQDAAPAADSGSGDEDELEGAAHAAAQERQNLEQAAAAAHYLANGVPQLLASVQPPLASQEPTAATSAAALPPPPLAPVAALGHAGAQGGGTNGAAATPSQTHLEHLQLVKQIAANLCTAVDLLLQHYSTSVLDAGAGTSAAAANPPP